MGSQDQGVEKVTAMHARAPVWMQGPRMTPVRKCVGGFLSNNIHPAERS